MDRKLLNIDCKVQGVSDRLKNVISTLTNKSTQSPLKDDEQARLRIALKIRAQVDQEMK